MIYHNLYRYSIVCYDHDIWVVAAALLKSLKERDGIEISGLMWSFEPKKTCERIQNHPQIHVMLPCFDASWSTATTEIMTSWESSPPIQQHGGIYGLAAQQAAAHDLIMIANKCLLVKWVKKYNTFLQILQHLKGKGFRALAGSSVVASWSALSVCRGTSEGTA